ncbi:transglycosylase SLT domain-containing protein [Neomesorhizobium albiziae]|uniref:transglycosylase SLT domain-containing protein n=1 Tax=Neomesorhizobium albiziae TaxID=335020 RepID=UPI00235D64B5|nr:lytic transglycosylase [Mesorhizobium albiziae]
MGGMPKAAARRLRTGLLAASISSILTTAAQAVPNACEPEILAAADRYGLPVGILYAVGLTETGKKGSLQPNALNIDGKALFPTSRQQAVEAFRQARENGAKFIDLGCMQINHRFHSEHFRSVQDMLDPHRNVDYAARFLVQLKRKHNTWSMAVARYHAGPDNDPAQKRYVCRVIANMVATGFGNWTPNARDFCNP